MDKAERKPIEQRPPVEAWVIHWPDSKSTLEKLFTSDDDAVKFADERCGGMWIVIKLVEAK